MSQIKKSRFRGFTFIEFVVSIGILMLLIGGLLSSYNNYNQSQLIKQTAQTVKANIRLAQSKALAAVKPETGCTEFVGYNVSFSATAYAVQAQCTDGLVGSVSQLSLPQGLSFSPVPNTLTFGVLTKGLLGVTTPVIVTVSGFSKAYQFVIEPNGVLTDSGFQ